jgi:hypothetical protein
MFFCNVNFAHLVTCFHADFLFGLFSDPEDGGVMFPVTLVSLSLPHAFTLIFCSVYFLTLKMEAIYSPVTLVSLSWPHAFTLMSCSVFF